MHIVQEMAGLGYPFAFGLSLLLIQQSYKNLVFKIVREI
jgi:hypothetical protein